jgi:hypothetical protein
LDYNEKETSVSSIAKNDCDTRTAEEASMVFLPESDGLLAIVGA